MLIISTFPFCLILLCSTCSLLFNNFPLQDLLIIRFLESTCHGNPFAILLFVLAYFHVLWCSTGSFPLFSPLPFWMSFTSLVWPLLFILFLTILFRSWILWGLSSSPTNVLLGHFLVYLLVSFLLSIFNARWMTSRFWVSHFGFFFPTKCIEGGFSHTCKGAFEIRGCFKCFWDRLSMFCPKTFLFTSLFPSFNKFSTSVPSFDLTVM